MEEIKTIGIADKKYPSLLKKIKFSPKVLYYKGKLIPNESCFAVVGTRRCSAYGKQHALEISGDLADYGLTIVSGLAPGIDTFSHWAAVERKKRTIAVLGTGLDEKSIYPKENIKLAEEIIKTGGCLISEYPPGTRGSKTTFPERNRIISGLSLGTLVIEAKQKSGSLITANWARKQNRKVFALPGPVQSLNSRGCHYLIKKGAILAEGANDILKELNFPQKSQMPAAAGKENGEEETILNVLREDALDIEKIIEKTKLPAQKVASLLAILEIKDKIRNLGGNTFAPKR